MERSPKDLKSFQVYHPSVSDLFTIPPSNISNPDETYLCYKELDNDASKDRFVSKLAIKMNTRFDKYIKEQGKKSSNDSPLNLKGKKVDPSLFVTDSNDEDDLAKAMFGSFSFEKRYRDSKSKYYYFFRTIDEKLNESIQKKD